MRRFGCGLVGLWGLMEIMGLNLAKIGKFEPF